MQDFRLASLFDITYVQETCHIILRKKQSKCVSGGERRERREEKEEVLCVLVFGVLVTAY